jgi:hypothetical protein
VEDGKDKDQGNEMGRGGPWTFGDERKSVRDYNLEEKEIRRLQLSKIMGRGSLEEMNETRVSLVSRGHRKTFRPVTRRKE